MTNFYNYINEKKMLKSTMIGFGLTKSNIEKISKYIESWLIKFNIKYEKITEHHVSIAQITDTIQKDEFVRLMNEINQKNYNFRPLKYTILKGRLNDFIAIELDRTKEYIDLYNKIKSIYNVVEFKGGMKPHISLFKLDFNAISDYDMAEILKNVPKLNPISAKKLELWNNKFKIEYSK